MSIELLTISPPSGILTVAVAFAPSPVPSVLNTTGFLNPTLPAVVVSADITPLEIVVDPRLPDPQVKILSPVKD